jgi:hypothetical protein
LILIVTTFNGAKWHVLSVAKVCDVILNGTKFWCLNVAIVQKLAHRYRALFEETSAKANINVHKVREDSKGRQKEST